MMASTLSEDLRRLTLAHMDGASILRLGQTVGGVESRFLLYEAGLLLLIWRNRTETRVQVSAFGSNSPPAHPMWMRESGDMGAALFLHPGICGPSAITYRAIPTPGSRRSGRVLAHCSVILPDWDGGRGAGPFNIRSAEVTLHGFAMGRLGGRGEVGFMGRGDRALTLATCAPPFSGLSDNEAESASLGLSRSADAVTGVATSDRTKMSGTLVAIGPAGRASMGTCFRTTWDARGGITKYAFCFPSSAGTTVDSLLLTNLVEWTQIPPVRFTLRPDSAALSIPVKYLNDTVQIVVIPEGCNAPSSSDLRHRLLRWKYRAHYSLGGELYCAWAEWRHTTQPEQGPWRSGTESIDGLNGWHHCATDCPGDFSTIALVAMGTPVGAFTLPLIDRTQTSEPSSSVTVRGSSAMALSDCVSQALALATRLASERGLAYVNVELLLLALLQEPEAFFGASTRQLARALWGGIAVRVHDLQLRGTSKGAPQLTRRCRNMLKAAHRRSKTLGHTQVEPEDVLVACLYETDGLGSALLRDAGCESLLKPDGSG